MLGAWGHFAVEPNGSTRLILIASHWTHRKQSCQTRPCMLLISMPAPHDGEV